MQLITAEIKKICIRHKNKVNFTIMSKITLLHIAEISVYCIINKYQTQWHPPHREGFTCPAKKYQCRVCHKFGHFTSQCFQKKQHTHKMYRQPKAHQIQIDESHPYISGYSSNGSSAEDSFCKAKEEDPPIF